MAKVYFIGDLHAGHKNVHKFRSQFNSEEEHFQAMKENYHSVVTKRDKVYFMGDAVFTLERLIDVASWNGTKVLICGNHDLDNIDMKTLSMYFDEVHAFCRYKEFWLSHCPIHPDELRGRKNIHGHTHNFNIDDARYFNTSLENIDFKPISLEEVKTRFEEQEMH